MLAIGNERIPLANSNNKNTFTLRHIVLKKNLTIPAQTGVKFPLKMHNKFMSIVNIKNL